MTVTPHIFQMAGMSKRKRSASTSSRKKSRSAMVKRSVSVPQVTIKRKWKAFTWIPQVSTINGWWRLFNFALTDMPLTERNEIINMFDSYRVKRFTVELVPRFIDFDAGGSTDAAQNPVPVLHYFIDNTAFPTTPGGAYDQAGLNNFAARANNSFKTAIADKVIRMSCVPTVESGTTGEVKPFPWTSTAFAPVGGHMQAWLGAVNFATLKNTSEFDVFYTLEMDLKGLK